MPFHDVLNRYNGIRVDFVKPIFRKKKKGARMFAFCAHSTLSGLSTPNSDCDRLRCRRYIECPQRHITWNDVATYYMCSTKGIP